MVARRRLKRWEAVERRWVGKRVRVSEGAGRTGVEGVVIPRSQVPKDHQGIPRLEGEGNYNPMSDNEVGIRMDNGHLLTMFTQYLQVVE